MVIVTDIKWKNKDDKKKDEKLNTNNHFHEGFYMDGYLAENLYPIPKFLKKEWDCVGIVSGHGKVRTGKSIMGGQIGYYVAWLLAGGEMDLRRDPDSGKFIDVKVTKKPDKPLKFSLNNLVFSPEELMEKGRNLPKNSVIIYDEGRSGLDSKSAMTSLNKMLEDFFQECGVYGHVIIIILPNFFKLHEDYSVSRSIFLVDVFHDKNWNRGFFNFYNEQQKEKLFFFGRKRVGITARYQAAHPSFYGKFVDWSPFDRSEYNMLKKIALKKKEMGIRSVKIKEQRDALIHMYKYDMDETMVGLAERLSEVLKKKVGVEVVNHALKDHRAYLEKKEELEMMSEEVDSMKKSLKE